MISHFARRSALAIPVLLGTAIVALAGTAGMTGSTSNAVQCSITEHAERGMLALEASILSPRSLSGQYRIAIQSSGNGGSSNVSQGGNFTAPAGQLTQLGKTLINAGTRYSADFTVTIGGQTVDCSQDTATLL